MRSIILVSENGLIDGAYSDDPNDLNITLMENTDRHDEERVQEYWKNQMLIEHGCYTDVMYMRKKPRNAYTKIKAMCSGVTESIRNSIRDTGNEKDIAFIDGFLAAWGSLNNYRISLMCSDKQEERKRGEMLNHCLPELIDAWKNTYETLCDMLWEVSEVENEDNTGN